MMPERFYTNGVKVGRLKPQTPDDVYDAAVSHGYPMPKRDSLCEADRLLIGYEALLACVAMKSRQAFSWDDTELHCDIARTRATVAALLPAYMRALPTTPSSGATK